MDSRKKKLLILLFLVVFSVICLLSIILLKEIKVQSEIKLGADKIISETNWPSGDVPFFYHDEINVDTFGDNYWNFSISSNIEYELYREYLIELYSEGFMPDSSVGSVDPKLLYTNLSTSGIDQFFWKGMKDDYSITVLWADEGAKDNMGVEYENGLSISLHKKKVQNIDANDSIGILSGENLSGDILSGDIASGENLSGDILSGDSLSEENLSGDNVIGEDLID